MTSPRSSERRPAITELRALITCALVGLVALFAPSPALAQTFTLLHNFTGGSGGAAPYAGVLIGRDGDLYGTTAAGGGGSCSGSFGTGCGTVFELNPSNQVFTTLWQFSAGSDGATPEAGLIIGPGGALYGSTFAGGVQYCPGGCGTVFRLTPPVTVPRTIKENRWNENILYSFQAPDGQNPLGNMAADGSGNIYGVAAAGGAFSSGVVFRLNYSNGIWTYSKLHEFSAYVDGEYPEGGVTLDASGNIYGTTFTGFGAGDVYQLLAASNWSLNILTSFWISTGDNPTAGVTLDSSGNVYGSTSVGGPDGGGTIFELSNGDWSFHLLYSLSGGAGPMLSNLIFDKAGNLYGTTYSDGSVDNGSYGTVFKLTPANGNWMYTSLHEFTGGSDGGYPVGTLAFDADGNLYGTASVGGDLSKCGGKGCGVVFRIMP